MRARKRRERAARAQPVGNLSGEDVERLRREDRERCTCGHGRAHHLAGVPRLCTCRCTCIDYLKAPDEQPTEGE